jgi:hypothetical protein
MKAEWVPVFVLDYPDMPEGNRALLKKGGLGLPCPFPIDFDKFSDWLNEQTGQIKPKPTQLGLF